MDALGRKEDEGRKLVAKSFTKNNCKVPKTDWNRKSPNGETYQNYKVFLESAKMKPINLWSEISQ
jgi:hypothetical protein